MFMRIRIRFPCEPYFYLMRILMRIRIQIPKTMRIRIFLTVLWTDIGIGFNAVMPLLIGIRILPHELHMLE